MISSSAPIEAYDMHLHFYMDCLTAVCRLMKSIWSNNKCYTHRFLLDCFINKKNSKSKAKHRLVRLSGLWYVCGRLNILQT